MLEGRFELQYCGVFSSLACACQTIPGHEEEKKGIGRISSLAVKKHCAEKSLQWIEWKGIATAGHISVDVMGLFDMGAQVLSR